MDVAVCPSRFEPLPRVVLEAMDAGTPVIASTADGCRELVTEFGGQLFPVGDAPALEQCLAVHVAQRQPRHRPDLSAHHLDRSGERLIRFYESLRREEALDGQPRPTR